MAKQKNNQPKRITNRRARHDYELGDSLVVGLELNGAETKSLRMGHEPAAWRLRLNKSKMTSSISSMPLSPALAVFLLTNQPKPALANF